jgi:hypothetical protein
MICWGHDCEHREGRYGRHPGDPYYYGRCRSGRRWFWVAGDLGRALDHDGYRPERGWEDTEGQALAAARAAVERLAGGQPGYASFRAGWATTELKRVNAERRRNRPDPGTSDAKPVEYLYAHNTWRCDNGYGRCPCRDLPAREAWQHHLIPYRITKKTAKRIYYIRREPHRDGQVISTDELEIGYVDRQKLEADGEVSNRGVHWSQDDSHLYATTDPPEWWNPWRSAWSTETATLSQLRKEMADAHPDRGGDRDRFMAARARYLAAKGATR